MKMSLSYLAGFFDGEGCITTAMTPKWNPRMEKYYDCFTIRMEVCNTDFKIIQDIHKFMKVGVILKIKPRKTATGNMSKPQLRWQTSHRQSYQVLKKILPFMREKNKIKKAKEVIKFYEKAA